jgi:hypothetical protein
LKSNPPDDYLQNNPKTCIYRVIPSSFKIYASFGKLEPAARNNLDRLGFGYRGTRDPRAVLTKGTNSIHIRIIKKIEPIQIHLDWAKKCYMNLNIKRKLKATRGNLMNLLNLAKIQ